MNNRARKPANSHPKTAQGSEPAGRWGQVCERMHCGKCRDKDAGCEWRISVGRLRPAGPADITTQTRNFQALKLSIRRNLSLPAMSSEKFEESNKE